jgi:hypothetical protein
MLGNWVSSRILAAVFAVSAMCGLSVTADTARADLILLQDDFSGTSLNSLNWTAYRAYAGQTGYPAGSSVTVADGAVTVAQDVTDHGGWLVSRPLTFASTGLITISDRVYVHANGGYVYGGTSLGDLRVASNPGQWNWQFGIQHMNSPFNAFTLGDNGINSSNGVGYGGGSNFGQVPAIWDSWVNETITLDPVTSMVTYSVNGGPAISGKLSTPMPQKPLNLIYNSYGWWTGHYEKIDSVSVKQARNPTFAPPTPSAPPSTKNVLIAPTPYSSPANDLDFALPFVTSNKVHLVTEAGGPSCDPGKGTPDYYDAFHAPDQAYYALDIGLDSGTGNVVAAKSGTIVHIAPATGSNPYPYVLIDNGDDYFTKYQEFVFSPTLKEGQTVAQGAVLGSFQNGQALHFQVAYDPSDTTTSGVGFSHQDNANLKGVTVGGLLLEDYKLNRDPNTLVNINGENLPQPLPTPISYPQITGNTSQVALDAVSAPLVSSTGAATVQGSSLSLHTGSPVWISSLVDIDKNANFLNFYAEFTSDSGADGLLTIYWDGTLIGTLDEQNALSGRALYSFAFPSDYEAGDYSVAFRLDPYTDVQSSIDIDGIGVGYFEAVPEPASLSMLLVSGLPLLLRKRIRSRGAV